MDIWRWVTTTKRELRGAGEERLAALLNALPGLVCDDEHARVEALVPEALALARAAKLPWVELFVRHWLLQSRVFHRHEVGRSIAEAVSLLDFSSGEATRSCPQSVCVTQDVAGCYSRIDGPGYVQERLAVAQESLDRIDPTWPCYSCISSEYADALIDDGRLEEALEFVRGAVAAAAAEGEFLEDEFALTEAHTLILLGRADEAVARLADHTHAPGGESHVLETRLLRAWALCDLDRFAEAAAELPPYAAIVDTADRYESWVRATLGLVRGGLVANDVAVGRQLRELYRRLEANGALWGAAEIAIAALRLADARGARTSAALIDADARRLVAQLRRPPPLPTLTAADALTAEVRAQIDGLDGDDDAAVGAFVESLDDDPEAALAPLAAARERLPHAAQLALSWARALRSAGFAERALADLEAFVQAHPPEEDAEGRAGVVLLELARLHGAAGDPRAVDAIVRGPLQAYPELYPYGLWQLAQAEQGAGAIARAIVTLRAVVELDDEAIPPQARLAELLREEGRFAEALEVRRRLVDRLSPGPHDWDLMSEAAIVGDWAAVRRSAARLEVPAPGDAGPIDANYGLCRVRVDGLDAGNRGDATYWAERRSPVTARIVEVVGPRGPERYDDLVAFDAADLGAAQEGADDDGDRRPIFRALATLERRDMVSYVLDGPHPGDAGLQALRELFGRLGGRLWIRSGDGYRLRDGDLAGDADDDDASDERSLLGLYAFFAVPRGDATTPGALDAHLRALTADWDYPLAWLDLASALDPGPARDEATARHQAIAARFQL
ncbi:MAG: hypothetical protein R3A79_01060 [Nannocystaceae bacterium]